MAKKKKKVVRKSIDSVSFEQALEELTTIVASLEDGQLGLEASLHEYEKGVKHLKQCHRLLANAERKIQLLKGIDADGNPVTQSFDDEEDESLEQKAQSRGRRRSAKRPAPEPDQEAGLFD